MKSLADLTTEYRERAASIDFVRLLSCRARSVSPAAAADLFVKEFPRALHARDVMDLVTKAATGAGTTTDGTWAAPLMVPALADAFVALVRTSSLLGRIPGLVRTPFNVRVPMQTNAGTYYWVQENAPKPITKLAFSSGITLAATKAQGIVAVSRELALLTTPGTEPALQRALVTGLTAFTDTQLLDPAVGAAPGRPASLTNGLTPVAATGTLDGDVAAVLAALFAQRPGATGAVLLATPATISKLAGTGKNPDAKVIGGTVQGVSILPTEGAGANLIAVDPAGVVVADAGVMVDVSKDAAVQLDDAPVGTAAAVVTSFFQTNLIGFRVERFVNWQAVAGAVAYVVAS